MTRCNFVGFWLLCLACFLINPPSAETQEQVAEEMEVHAIPLVAQDPDQTDRADDEPNQDLAEATEDGLVSPPQPVLDSLDGQYIRFHLWDGLIVGGDASIESIDVQTEFGSLQIPISKIMRFYPGLDSMSGLQSRIDELIEGLGDRNFDVRERSHNELLKMGLLLRHEIHRYEDGGSAERKKHLTDLRKKIDELDEEDDSGQSIRPLIRADFIQTPNFSVVGKIVQTEFQLKSPLGEMVVPLSEIKMGDRTFGILVPETRKTVDVETSTFFPDGMNTKIRINRGDKILISASGEMGWTNWSTTCGPEGMNDKGQYRSFRSGTLLMKIGDKGELIKVGTTASFIAKTSGDLYLGVAMAENFRSGGYNWTGKYSAKIVVKPKESP